MTKDSNVSSELTQLLFNLYSNKIVKIQLKLKKLETEMEF